ncbi:S-layer homology domain-containing protein [Paenibacillus sp. HB172176]|uniref:S-layer homology domain-containing protein n=1 Tax=Paenibacillus sp. HB172176 TaxID=2493690 RepID=UPI00143C7081|nr:S-layer homology domain-containing protein [Paenibacillus sp. HB172176]
MYSARMRKRVTISLLVALFVMSSFALFPVKPVMASPSGFSGTGSGTESNPYIIMTAAQLDEVRNDLGAHYKLGANIDLAPYLSDGGAGYTKWGAAGWDPIGYEEFSCFNDFDPESCFPKYYYFTGSFDGNGYTISHLTINRSEEYIGLFGDSSGAQFTNVKLEDIDVTGYSFSGGLVGKLTDSDTIDRSYASGKVQGMNLVGGLVGGSYGNSTVSESYTAVDVKGTGAYIGGLIGLNYANINNSYATGSVEGHDQAGGLVGLFAIGTINTSYAIGAVTGGDPSGGLVGKVMSNGVVANSYYDASTTGQSDTDKGTGRTTAEMWQQSTYSGWDFTNVWTIEEGTDYPALIHNNQTSPAVNSVSVTPETTNVVQGGTRQLTASVDAVGGAATTVTWSSSDTNDKVTVDESGLVTVAADAAAGDYTITATSIFDGTKSDAATLTVTLAPAVNSVSVTPETANIVQGGTRQLSASVDAVGGAAKTVTWSSSDANDKVTVDESGLVTVAADAAAGDYTITATSTFDGTKSDAATLTVTLAPAVNSVSVTPETANVVQGGTRQLSASVDAVGGAATTVTWSSSDTNDKVTVDENGLVTVAADAAAGDYTITATSTFDGTKHDAATLTVTLAPAVNSVSVTPETANVVQGGTRQLSASVDAVGGAATTVTWSSSDTNDKVTVDESGLVAVAADAAAGDYTITATSTFDGTKSDAATITVTVSLPDPPANPQNLSATAGNRSIDLSWDTVTGATYYTVYMSEVPDVFSDTLLATVTEATYQVQNLSNGTSYYFVVNAGNSGGLSAASNEVSATPATVPAVPTNAAATAGNGSATITFTPPDDNGGSPITGYEVFDSGGKQVATASSDATSVAITGLTNGTSYTFTVKAKNAKGYSDSSAPSNSVTPRAPSNNSDDDDDNPLSQPSPEPEITGADVLVNGKVENAGTATTDVVDGQKVTIIAVDDEKLQQRLEAEGDHAVITIQASLNSEVIVGEFNGRMVKNMENQQAVVEIRTDKAAYLIPAEEINIDALSERLGTNLALQDIKVRVEIAEPLTETVRVVNDAASRERLTLVVPPLNFKVSAVYGDRTEEVTEFNAYVERTIALPDDVDPTRITTGVVVDPDGTVRHVPTKVIAIDGKYYVKVNSLTNSTYSVVWHPLEFMDVASHWAKDAVNDMGSRMVISGVDNGRFNPDQAITRAEFAAIIVRGLGLKPENGTSVFTDVKETDWYNGAINTAYAYHLINGLEDGTFRPNDKITREQAMVIINKAMAITNLKAALPVQPVDVTLRPYIDTAEASSWALDGIADCVQSGIVSGRSGMQLAPKEHLTRAEVAVIVQRLLQKSELIK